LQWPPLLDDISIKSETIDFYHFLADNFLAQHVDFCTRNDAILDLVISDEPNFVSDMMDLPPLQGSDHNVLAYKLEVRTKQKLSTRRIFDYAKADTEAIKSELNAVQIGILSWEACLPKTVRECSETSSKHWSTS